MKALVLAACLAVMGGCVGGAPQTSSDASAMQACPQPPPDPVPCIRLGTALSGGALWLMDEVNEGNATDIAVASAEVSRRADAYDLCAEALVNDISSYNAAQH